MPTVVTRDLESNAVSPSSYVVGGEASVSAPSFSGSSGVPGEVVVEVAVVLESPESAGGGVVVCTTMPPVLRGWVVVVD